MIENFQYDREETHDAIIVTCQLSSGFRWLDEKGEWHDEMGFQFPEVAFHKGTVQELFNGNERSVGWYE